MANIMGIPPPLTEDKIDKKEVDESYVDDSDLKENVVTDAFGNEETAAIKYKTLTWWYVWTH